MRATLTPSSAPTLIFIRSWVFFYLRAVLLTARWLQPLRLPCWEHADHLWRESGCSQSHGNHSPRPAETAPRERPALQTLESLPRAEYQTAVAVLLMVVESVGAVAVATDELADASVTVKATLAFLQLRRFSGEGLVFIPAGGGVDVTSTVVAAPTDRHVVAVRQPWTCTGSFMLTWNRGKTRQAGKRSGSGFIHAEAHFPNICTACLFFYFGGKTSSHFSNK